MQVISSTSLKEKLVLKPCYRPRPILPLSAHGFEFPISGNSISTSSFRFNQLTTPNRSVKTKKPFADNKHNQSKGQIAGTAVATGTKKKACMCSPSKHPGAFRCTRHKKPPHGRSKSTSKTASSYHSSVRLRYRRLAMNNSLVRIGGVAGDMVKRALVTQVKSSGHNQRRRAHFQPKPSRLSVMSTE